ncbi:gamma-glutamyltransferase family protein [Paenibacillus montanisoli]|uniref:Gamma-glutamyltransferase n=1 Tax=Paenibacillus montanisoli TaxID=2081970 RepID=A0A328TWW8_9BACL|nr:gamma-glutamyltransferase family protein [Paenibacillus montanisoli]RAP73571.1 gamma-glutamyltransferase [Paenibacillus montanisoli]
MFNAEQYTYPSMRYSTYAGRGMVSTSQPLAAQAGLDMLKRGGNAIDAAVAAAACLTVVEPNNNGIGSDTFALVWSGGRLHGLNASGPAPAAISMEKLAERGFKEMPAQGVIPVTVPGAPGAWAELSRRFGRLALTEVMAPAAAYAEEGFNVATLAAEAWRFHVDIYAASKVPEVRTWFAAFADDNGKAPRAGERFRLPHHAETLRRIAESGAAEFYEGMYAEKIDRFMREHGGYLRKSDLEAFRPEWVEPISVNYRGYDVWEIPPNGQGLVALMALNILKGFEFESPYSADTLHKQFEAMKLAYADGKAYITDSRMMKVKVEDLLSDAYADERRRLIGRTALKPFVGKPSKGGTVYVCTADDEGNMVSLIQSNYMGFGSGVVIPGTGISLQNRGHNFSLDPKHDNCLMPGKRTFHTIIPSFLTKGGEAIGPFGMVGGFMQPQGHVQTVMNTVDFAMNPQQALDAPRWQWMEELSFQMEGSLPEEVSGDLTGRGHQLTTGCRPSGLFGRGNIIWRLPNGGGFAGASDFRSDGTVACR